MLEHFHMKAALDLLADLAFHRHAAVVGVFEHIEAADAGQGLGQTHAVVGHAHHVEFQRIALGHAQLSGIVQQFLAVHDAVHGRSAIHESRLLANGNDCSGNLVPCLEGCLTLGLIGCEQLGKIFTHD
jgi:hypothetical protein